MASLEEMFNEIQKEIKERTKKGSKKYYKPLDDVDSYIVERVYKSRLKIPTDGNNHTKFYNSDNTLLAVGYVRVVIGDYGPYIEFSKSQMQLNNIKQKWAGEPKRPVKYIWLQSKDQVKTKVYEQRGMVKYADYNVGMYYMDPKDLHTDGLDILMEQNND